MNNLESMREFTKDMNDFTVKNFEIANKYWKAAIEQNQECLLANTKNYFGHVGTNLNYTLTLWNNYVKGREEMSKLFAENLDRTLNNFKKLYEETVETTRSRMNS